MKLYSAAMKMKTAFINFPSFTFSPFLLRLRRPGLPQTSHFPSINSDDSLLQEGIASSISRVQEFAHIQRIADEMGIEVWLFGGTASSFVHYVHSEF